MKHGLGWALVVGALAAFACSDNSSGTNAGMSAGNAGRGDQTPDDAGAANGGKGNAGGRGSNEAGAQPHTDDGEAGAAGSNEADAGTSGEAGAPNATGEAGKGHGGTGSSGAPSAAGSGGKSSIDLYPLGTPNADCQADLTTVIAPPALASGLLLPPNSGHKCDATLEPNDSEGQACQLALRTNIATQLSVPTDQIDNFVFHAEAGVTYTLIISTLSCVGSSNYLSVTAKSLAAGGQTQQLDRYAYFGTRTASEIRSNTTADELVTFQTGQTCQYDFQVVQSTDQGLVQDTQYEPNDTPSTATRISLNQLVTTNLSGSSDTADYFAFPAQANLTYSVHVSTEHCAGSSNYLNLTGSSLGSGAPVTNLGVSYLYFGGAYDKELTTTTSGLQLLAFTTGSSCEYSFYVEPSTVCGLGHGAEYEPNNTPSSAAPIAIDQTVYAELRSPADAVDYYTFPVAPNAKYSLTVSTANCAGASNYLSAQLWSGRREGLDNGGKSFFYAQANMPLSFTTGSATQELVAIKSGSSCGYQLSVSKN